jgi:hypothetical protein
MRRLGSAALVVMAGLAVAAPRWDPNNKKETGRARISLYRVESARHLEFLRWLAAREEVAKEAGLRPAQMYVHLDGDAWDYLLIAPATTPEQDERFDAVAKTRGVKTGFAAALEFRAFLDWHTDTLATGPHTAAELLAEASR